MLQLVVPMLSCVAALGAPAQDAAKSDAKAELVTLAKKIEDASSYTFTFKSSSNAKGQEKDEDERPWTVEVQKDRPRSQGFVAEARNRQSQVRRAPDRRARDRRGRHHQGWGSACGPARRGPWPALRWARAGRTVPR